MSGRNLTFQPIPPIDRAQSTLTVADGIFNFDPEEVDDRWLSEYRNQFRYYVVRPDVELIDPDRVIGTGANQPSEPQPNTQQPNPNPKYEIG
jgi:hypothetical protein